jgi:hypothetical protein
MDVTPLPPAFDRSFRDAARQDLAAAYGLSAERLFSPSDGWGAMMFGLGVFYNVDRRFRERYRDHDLIRHVQTMRGPELRVSDLRVIWRKTGSRLAPPDAVDRPSDRLIDMAMLNMAPQLSLGFERPVLTNWVIAHSGSPTDGLLTAHLAAPRIATDGRRIVAWIESVAIFDARRPGLDFPEMEAPGLPEAVDLPELDLEFRTDAPERIDEADDGRHDQASGDE